MKFRHRQEYVIASLVVTLALICLWCLPALAQCPLCKMAVENSAQGRAMGRGLNLGILVLLVPPVTVFCSFFIIAIKHRKMFDEEKKGV